MNFSELPLDCISSICEFLTHKEILNLLSTNSQLSTISKQQRIYKQINRQILLTDSSITQKMICANRTRSKDKVDIYCDCLNQLVLYSRMYRTIIDVTVKYGSARSVLALFNLIDSTSGFRGWLKYKVEERERVNVYRYLGISVE